MEKSYILLLLLKLTFIKNSIAIDLNYKCYFSSNDLEPKSLSPYILNGSIEDAKIFAKVNYPAFNGVTSYSGYLTVDFNSSLFFWYFEAERNTKDAPVILWLQGAPAMSSLNSIFYENGPFLLDEDRIYRRFYSLNRNYHAIYIDSPVGTGLSVLNEGRVNNMTRVGDHLYSALKQFFIIFPELQNNDFFIAGESGKYIPILAYKIHKENDDADVKINLKGFSIGNGLSDPIHQLKYGDYLYQFGLIDIHGLKEFVEYEELIREYISNEKWEEAYNTHQLLIGTGYPPSIPTLFTNLTGYTNIFNFLEYKYDYERNMDLDNLLQKEQFRQAIHIGDVWIERGSKVQDNLKVEFAQSVMPLVSELLSNYRVVVYTGLLDISVGFRVTQDYLLNMTCSGCDDFRNSTKGAWIVNGDLAGYVTSGGNLTSILVRNAGHFVQMDQPKWGMDIIDRLVSNQPFMEEDNEYY